MGFDDYPLDWYLQKADPTFDAFVKASYFGPGVPQFVWDLQGTEDYVSVQKLGHEDEDEIEENEEVWRVRISDTGHITVRATVGATTAACTFTLWKAELTTDAEEDTSGHPHYTCTRADEVTTQLTLHGGVQPIQSGGVPVEWESKFVGDEDVLNYNWGSDLSWGGAILDWTEVKCKVTVENPYSVTYPASATKTVRIHPERRDNWTMQRTIGTVDRLWQANEIYFPQKTDFIALGQNTNNNPDYREDHNNQIIITPIYNDQTNFFEDYVSFHAMYEGVYTGPNAGLFYNTNANMYAFSRYARLNYWTTPNAGKPNSPSLGPDGSNYTNWLDIQARLIGDYCNYCSYPAGHGGLTADYRDISNEWHEADGPPQSPNRLLLGHMIRMTEWLDDNPFLGDPCYQIEPLYAPTVEGLRVANEAKRAAISQDLLDWTQELHAYVTWDWKMHNFYGSYWLWTYETAEAVWMWKEIADNY